MNTLRIMVISVGCTVISITSFCNAAELPTFMWEQTISSPRRDRGECVTGDNTGNVFIAGTTEGNLNTETETTGYIFLSKISIDADILWTRQFGPTEGIDVSAIAIDQDGNCYLAGQTNGPINETNPAGADDAFIVKYDPNGIMLWEQLLGTTMNESALAMVIDANSNCYITGSTSGTLDSDTPVRSGRCPFIAKYNTDGQLLWLDQLRQGGAQEGHAISVYSDGTIYTTGKPGYIARHDPNGVLIDSFMISISDYLNVTFDDQANLYACGFDSNITAFVEKYDPSGNRLWRRQFRETGWTAPKYIVMCKDGSGDVLTGGCQQGPRGPNDCQAFARRFDVDGNQTLRYDHPGVTTCGQRVGIGNAGSFLLTGNKNARDAFVVKLGFPDDALVPNTLEAEIDTINQGIIIEQCPCPCSKFSTSSN